LLEEILGHLDGDKSALLACTRACRALADVARRQLYRRVTIRSTKQWCSFSDILEHVPSLIPLVRVLVLQECTQRAWTRVDFIERAVQREYLNPGSRLGVLLAGLEISGLKAFGGRTLEWFSTHLLEVTTLRLDGVNLPAPMAAALLEPRPRLRSVALRARMPYWEWKPQASMSFFGRFEELEIDGNFLQCVGPHAWRSVVSDNFRLWSLTLRSLGPNMISALLLALDVIGGALRRLDIVCISRTWPEGKCIRVYRHCFSRN
jgi:hypothetical protein